MKSNGTPSSAKRSGFCHKMESNGINGIFGFLEDFLILFFFNFFKNLFLIYFSKLFRPPHIMDIFSTKFFTYSI